MLFIKRSRNFTLKSSFFRSKLYGVILLSCVALIPITSTNALAQEIVVVVNNENPVDKITSETLRAIFKAQRFTFDNGSEAVVVNLGGGNQLKNDFYKKATGISAKIIQRRWAAAAFSGETEFPKEFKTVKELILWIKENKNTIGYMASEDATSDVKVIMRLP